MKIGIVINGFYMPQRLLEQVDKLIGAFSENAVCQLYKTTDLLATVDNGKVVSYIDCDAVIYLDKDIHIARMLEKCGIRLFNSACAIALADDKMATHIALANSGIAMPTTVSSPLRYSNGGDVRQFLNKIVDQLGFPLVVKQCHGSFGAQVTLINNYNDLQDAYYRLRHVPHIYQRFIASSAGRDIRIIVIGGKVVAAMTRRNVNDFRSNIEQGGMGIAVEINSLERDYINYAVDAARILGLDYAGVDILIGDGGEPILCEINSNAYFNTIAEVTGVNIAAKYTDYILSVMKP